MSQQGTLRGVWRERKRRGGLAARRLAKSVGSTPAPAGGNTKAVIAAVASSRAVDAASQRTTASALAPTPTPAARPSLIESALALTPRGRVSVRRANSLWLSLLCASGDGAPVLTSRTCVCCACATCDVTGCGAPILAGGGQTVDATAQRRCFPDTARGTSRHSPVTSRSCSSYEPALAGLVVAARTRPRGPPPHPHPPPPRRSPRHIACHRWHGAVGHACAGPACAHLVGCRCGCCSAAGACLCCSCTGCVSGHDSGRRCSCRECEGRHPREAWAGTSWRETAVG